MGVFVAPTAGAAGGTGVFVGAGVFVATGVLVAGAGVDPGAGVFVGGTGVSTTGSAVKVAVAVGIGVLGDIGVGLGTVWYSRSANAEGVLRRAKPKIATALATTQLRCRCLHRP